MEYRINLHIKMSMMRNAIMVQINKYKNDIHVH